MTKRRGGAIGGLAVIVAVLASPAAVADPTAYPGFPQYNRAFQVGPTNPGSDSNYKPQGLAHLRQNNSDIDWLLVAMYQENHPTKLAIINRTSGAAVKTLFLSGPNHAGGLAISNRFLWVADTDDVLAYPLQSVKDARNGQTISPAKVLPSPPGTRASWVTYAENHLWVGSHEERNSGGRLFTYTINVDGSLVCCGVRGKTIPTLVQGMEVTGPYFVYSRSLGQGNSSTFTLQSRANGVYTHVSAPGMSQDGTLLGGNTMYFNDESSSLAFPRAPVKVRNINYTTIDALIRQMMPGDR